MQEEEDGEEEEEEEEEEDWDADFVEDNADNESESESDWEADMENLSTPGPLRLVHYFIYPKEAVINLTQITGYSYRHKCH